VTRRRIGPSAAVAITIAMVAACGLLPKPVAVPAPSISTPPVQTGQTDGSTPPTNHAAPDSSGWTRVATGDPASATQFGAVAAVADGFVVVGSTGQAAEIPVAVHSADGVAWTVEEITGRAGMSPRFVAPWADRLLVTGGGQSARCAHPGGEMDPWLRAADGTWTEAPFDPVFCVGGPVAPIIHDGRAWLIGAGVADVPFLLDSMDGFAWTDHRERLGDVFVQSAISGSGGIWIDARAPDGSALILRSADGGRFTKMPLIAASGKAVDVIAAVALRDRAVLLVTDGSATSILTADGSGGWLEAEASGLPHLELVSVQVVDDHLVALGSSDNKPQRAWSSADGSSWTAIDLPDEVARGATIGGMAASNGIAVLTGQVEAPDGSIVVGAIWTGPATLLAS
jgi:hypothetical protein